MRSRHWGFSQMREYANMHCDSCDSIVMNGRERLFLKQISYITNRGANQICENTIWRTGARNNARCKRMACTGEIDKYQSTINYDKLRYSCKFKTYAFRSMMLLIKISGEYLCNITASFQQRHSCGFGHFFM